MEWITVYEISRFAFPWELIAGISFVLGGGSMFLGIFSKENRKRPADGEVAVKFLLCPIMIIIGCFAVWFAGESILSGEFNKYARTYYDGEYAVIEGVAENIDWSKSGFSFSMDGVRFHCSQGSDVRLIKNTESHFEAEKTLRVYYYDKEYFNKYAQEYHVMRIDVWDMEI